MSLPPEQIDWIVREVIRRLREHGVAVGGGASPAAETGAELAITDRVVTTATFDGQLAGVALVRVQRRAVVTPAARDLLKERGVRLVREA